MAAENFARRCGGVLGRCALVVTMALALSSCSGPGIEIPASERPLSKQTLSMLGAKGMRTDAPIFIRIFKQESELEVWKARDDGRFYHFKTYPICNWSGELGPKLKQGDKQSPEGFYVVAPHQMNPESKFHLSFNLGFPNSFDKANRRTGQFLMVHGDCLSAGCYAMTDALIEEIYALVRESFKGSQKTFQVHAYPFRMTRENLKKHRRSRWRRFWQTLKDGHDQFELTRKPPEIRVCENRYLVNVRFGPGVRNVNPAAACPPFQRLRPEPFVPTAQVDTARHVVPGHKTRTFAAAPDVSRAGWPAGDAFAAPPRSALGFGN